jgi:hypothetical protein
MVFAITRVEICQSFHEERFQSSEFGIGDGFLAVGFSEFRVEIKLQQTPPNEG